MQGNDEIKILKKGSREIELLGKLLWMFPGRDAEQRRTVR